MLAKAQKWGNSLAVRLPKSVSEECGITDGSAVEIVRKNNFIVIKPVKRKLSLDQLLGQITEFNQHAEIPTGAPLGKEIL